MPRPKRERVVSCEPDYICLQPEGISPPGVIVLAVEEYEVIRLVDYEGKTHSEAAEQMQISRTTVTEIYESARHKLADCLVNGKRLVIEGGCYRICGSRRRNGGHRLVEGRGGNGHGTRNEVGGGAGSQYADGNTMSASVGGSKESDIEESDTENTLIEPKGSKTMRVAVTYEDGQIFQHFGHTEQFKVYDIEDGAIVSSAVIGTDGFGHGALAGFLADNQVDALICGGIGGGAQMALADAGVRLYGGVSGSADEAAQALAEGRLGYNPDVRCNHHGAGHQCAHGSHGGHRGEGHQCGHGGHHEE